MSIVRKPGAADEHPVHDLAGYVMVAAGAGGRKRSRPVPAEPDGCTPAVWE